MSQKKRERRAKRRMGITAQLVFGEDDDLIAWYKSLPDGAGNQAIKTLLRHSLNLSQPMQPLTPEQAEIESLYGEIDQLRAQIGQLGYEGSSHKSGRAELSGEFEEWFQVEYMPWISEEIQKVYSKINEIQVRIEQGISTPNQAGQMGDSEGLSNEAVKRKQKKMSKNAW